MMISTVDHVQLKLPDLELDLFQMEHYTAKSVACLNDSNNKCINNTTKI